jgi:hypothetical protein
MEIWGAQRTLVEKEYWRRHYSGTFILKDGICVSNRRVHFLLANAALARCILNRAVHPNIQQREQSAVLITSFSRGEDRRV